MTILKTLASCIPLDRRGKGHQLVEIGQHLNKPLRYRGYLGHKTIQDPGFDPSLTMSPAMFFSSGAMGYAQGKNPVDHRLAEVIEAELGSLNGSGNGKVLPKFYVPKAVAWQWPRGHPVRRICCMEANNGHKRNENSHPPNIHSLLICIPPSLVTPCYSYFKIFQLSMGSNGSNGSNGSMASRC